MRPPTAPGSNLWAALCAVLFMIGCGKGATPTKDAAAPADLTPIIYHRAPPRAEPAFGFDGTANHLVIFGGDDGAEVGDTFVPSYHADTWIYDVASNAWSASAATGPSARGRPAFAMDSKNHRLLMALGRYRSQSAGTTAISFTLPDDTWAYDVAGDKWTQLMPSGTPPGRSGTVAIYDAAKDRMVVFGGDLATSFDVLGFKPTNETWQLVGGTTWSQVMPMGTQPAARYLAGAALDTKRNRMVVVGGCCDDFGTFFSDAWALDLATDTWSQLAEDEAGPTNRVGMGTVYDSAADRVIIFGGHDDGPVGKVNDLWALEGTGNWTNLHIGDQPNDTKLGCAGNKTEAYVDFVTIEAMSPERRERSVMVWAGDHALLYGGAGDCGQLDDTWSIALGAWGKLIPAEHGESCMHRGDECTCLCQ